MKLKNKTILITGGDGFIGSAISELLAPDNRIVVFDIGERGALDFTDLLSTGKVRFIKGDVLDRAAVEEASKGCDIIIHMAAIAGVSQYYSRPVRTLEVNIVGTLNVLKAALKSRAERFVYCSSSEIYGNSAYNVNEETDTSQGPATQSRWSYAVGKLAGEHLAMSYCREKGLPVVSLRPFNIYGPRQIHPCAVQTMTLKALRGEDIIIHGDGAQIRAWCYVDDFARATRLAIEKKEAAGGLFNIGNSEATVSILELAKKIKKISGSKSRMVLRKNPYVDIIKRRPDVSKAKKVLSFEASTGIDEGLRKTISWYGENQNAFIQR